MRKYVVLCAECREPFYPSPSVNVHPIQVAIVQKGGGKRKKHPDKPVSSMPIYFLDKQGVTYSPFIFLGDILLKQVLDVKGDPKLGTLGDRDMLFVRIRVRVTDPIRDVATGWISLHRLTPGLDYELLRKRFPQLPLRTNWPK